MKCGCSSRQCIYIRISREGKRKRGKHMTEMLAHFISTPSLLNRIWSLGSTRLQRRWDSYPAVTCPFLFLEWSTECLMRDNYESLSYLQCVCSCARDIQMHKDWISGRSQFSLRDFGYIPVILFYHEYFIYVHASSTVSINRIFKNTYIYF